MIARKTFDKPLPNNEPQLRELFARLRRKGRVLVVVDQPASIGTLPVAVARAGGCDVAYLPGLSMRRLADLHPGTGRTDARDAFVIAARTARPRSSWRPILQAGSTPRQDRRWSISATDPRPVLVRPQAVRRLGC